VTQPAVCPRCSAPFACSADTGGCWCNEIALSAKTRAAFAEFFDGCLCRDCLEQLEQDRPAVPTVRAFLMSQLKRKRA
jgi:hypothetical protein